MSCALSHDRRLVLVVVEPIHQAQPRAYYEMTNEQLLIFTSKVDAPAFMHVHCDHDHERREILQHARRGCSERSWLWTR